MLEGSELNRTPSLYNLNAWDTQAIFLKMEMCIARCKSWSPTNKVNCLFFTTGIDRRSLTTDPLFCPADLECLYSLFTCRSIFFFVFETKKLKLSGAHTAWGHLFGKFTSENDNPKSFFLCSFKQNWMAFTNLRVQNFTLADSLAFTNNRSLSRSQDNFALCQVYVRS